MAMSLASLVGIIAGGVGLTSLTVVLLVLVLRHRHRRILAQIDSGGERGLSSFPRRSSQIMSITDEDVARMPGARASVHRSLHPHYNRNNLYTPMASRENLPPRAYIPRARATDQKVHQPVSPQQSWPLPRRMTRADGTPLVKMPSATSTSNIDRSGIFASAPPKEKRNVAGKSSSDAIGLDENLNAYGPDSDTRRASSVTDLAPKPLFHGQQRSSSYGVISGLADGSKTEPRTSRRMSQFPRSKSMYSQDPGVAPPQPLPPLPFEIVPMRLPIGKSPEQSTRRASGGSLFSDQTSILDDHWSKAFPPTARDLTSTALTSASTPGSPSKASGQNEINHVVWDSSHEEGKSSPLGAAKQMSFRPQLNTQRSFRASVQGSLPRSKSSGLSLSMSLHGPSRAESRASPIKDPSSTNSKSKVLIPRTPESRRLGRGISPSSALGRAANCTIHDDTTSKRASTSVLHEVSGNEGSPVSESWDERPHSIATTNPLEWDKESLPTGKSSTPKHRKSGHQRQNCIRTSSILLVVPSPPQEPTIEEQDERPQYPQHHDLARPKRTTFRPPSRQDFDFALQSTLGLDRDNSRIKNGNSNNNSPFSPTQFMMNLYRGDDNNNPDFEIDTPTRKPNSRQSSSSTHLNRRKTIFDHPTPTVWPPSTPTTKKNHPDPAKPHPTTTNLTTPSRLSAQSPDQDSTPGDSRPPSFLLNFPWPQPPTPSAAGQTSSPRGGPPKTPIRGPRAPPPFRFTSSPTNRRRSSPLRAAVSKRGCCASPAPKKDLRRSVGALRRMNSDVMGGSGGGRKSREHKRYLSLGDDSEGGAIFEEGEEEEAVCRGLEIRGGFAASRGESAGGLRRDGKENVIGGPRDMNDGGGMTELGDISAAHDRVGMGLSGRVTTRDDGDGFLKDLDSSCWLR